MRDDRIAKYVPCRRWHERHRRAEPHRSPLRMRGRKTTSCRNPRLLFQPVEDAERAICLACNDGQFVWDQQSLVNMLGYIEEFRERPRDNLLLLHIIDKPSALLRDIIPGT